LYVLYICTARKLFQQLLCPSVLHPVSPRGVRGRRPRGSRLQVQPPAGQACRPHHSGVTRRLPGTQDRGQDQEYTTIYIISFWSGVFVFDMEERKSYFTAVLIFVNSVCTKRVYLLSM